MTALDAGVVLLLGLIAAGGYRQGLLRGLTRLATLGTIAAAAALLSFGLSSGGSIQGVLLRAGLLFGGVLVIVVTASWLFSRLVPYSVHRAPLNKWLGVVPALALGILALALALGLAQRIAFGDGLERYLAGGIVTGPLGRPVLWIERNLVTAQR